MREQFRRFFRQAWGLLQAAPGYSAELIRLYPRSSIAVGMAGVLILLGAWRLGEETSARAIYEERIFWSKARELSLAERTMIRNHMVRTGRVPHLLPWWEMDMDRCAAVSWKLVNLLTGIELTHGQNGAAWMLRRQNGDKLRTLWDGTPRFDKDARLGERLRLTIEEFRLKLDSIHPNGVYLAGFRWTETAAANKIRRDKADLNSHVVTVTGSVLFHMFSYGVSNDPIVADLQERFFASEEMQPVWLAEVTHPNGKPFRFAASKRELRLDQRVYPWRDLRFLLRIPDWMPGANAVERCLLFWIRNGYDMYPRLP